MSELRREFGRKAFHMLSLVYWAAFLLLGWPRAARWAAIWLAVVFVVESARLRVPLLDRAFGRLFEGMIRDGERRHFSGIFHTTCGCLAAMLIAGGRVGIVSAAIFQLAFGDAAAALAGKAFGRTRLFGGKKTLEGSLAGFAAGYAAALLCGIRPGAALAAAAAAALVEVVPTTPYFNDNLWIPAVSAAVLRLLAR